MDPKMIELPASDRGSRAVGHDWVKYGSGPYKGLFVVRRYERSDHAAFATQQQAQAFIREQELKEPK